MSDKTAIVEKPSKIGILRKRNTSLAITNNAILKPRITGCRAKEKLDSNPVSARSVDCGGSNVAKRNEITRIKPTAAPATAPVTPRSISRSPSNLTVGPHISAASSNSVVHKPGFIPAYLRNRGGTKNLVAVQVQCNRKQFIQIKKELLDLQKKAVEYYRRYRESLVKLNKLNGIDGPLAIEELQIVDFKEQSDVAEVHPIATNLNKIKPNLHDEKLLSNISQQVRSVQMYSFKVMRDFSEYLSSLLDNSDGINLCPAKLQKLRNEIETKIVSEEEQQNMRLTNFITNLKQMMNNEIVDDKWENDWKINELGETETKCDDRSKEMLLLSLKQLKLANKRLEKQQDDKMLEMIEKDKSIVEFKSSIKSLQDKVIKYSNHIQILQSKLVHIDEEYKNQIEELKTKYDDEVKSCNVLRSQIDELNLGMADDYRAMREDNVTLKNNGKLLMKEIDSLKLSLKEMLLKKPAKERSKTEENVFRRELERRDHELKRLNKTLTDIKEDLVKKDIIVAQKLREINEFERKIKQLETRGKINEFQEEIHKQQEINGQKSKEIERLQSDLNKAETALQLQEESLFMQQRLLQIRSELIQSLQENEESTNNQIADLNLEVERTAYTVKQLHQEVSSKTEELENLFSTMGAKNLEVKRQDHIIHMLEETHERNQKFRVKLEGKIARLERENSELKRFLIELNIPFNSNTTKSIDDTNNVPPYNNHFYENLRRKKRFGQTIIKVKKYNN